MHAAFNASSTLMPRNGARRMRTPVAGAIASTQNDNQALGAS